MGFIRLAKYALELKRPVAMLNVGPTRADDLLGVTKIELPTGLVMRDVAKAVMYVIIYMLPSV